MPPTYCSQGHPNPAQNRFCSTCGEKLAPVVQGGLVLGDRYRVVRQLGQGEFGRSYLAEDINRFNEACVLKEFAPQVQGSAALQKAEDLFEQEAGLLYKLQHPQIPRFRELFRVGLEGRDRLFLVQDYVEGRTYRQLLEDRQSQGICFSEVEIRQLFAQILPVLDYLHSAGVIHRDLSPDNLILRSSDQLPVLIDFGGVKQAATTATSEYIGSVSSTAETAAPVTRSGKLGYAPDEQIHQGLVSPQSDLYALAVTALVLLTGKDPLELLDRRHTGRQMWQSLVAPSPELTAVLTTMLAVRLEDRFPSAQSVLQALHLSPAQPASTPSTSAPTLPVSPALIFPASASTSTSASAVTSPAPSRPASPSPTWIKSLLLLIPLILLVGTGWWWRDRLPLLIQAPDGSPSEPSSQTALEKDAEAAKVDYLFLVKLTNQTFYERYPDQKGRTLTEAAADAEWRQRWTALADEWLTVLEQNLSTTGRERLGSYTEAERNQWKETINQLYVGSRSLYDLTDAEFFHLFPEQQGRDFLDQPIGQVWQAIAVDQIQALQNGTTLKQIEFEPGAFSQQESGELAVGAGQVYIANLAVDQIMRLNLQAPTASSQLSIYLPRPTADLPVLLEDAADVTWTGTLPQSGYYEIVIVNIASQPIRYQLNLAVDNVTSTPIEPAQGEAPEAKD